MRLDYALEGFWLSKRRNYSPNTIMNHWIALSSFWTWASGELKIPHIVREHVERPKVTRRQSQPYARHEVQAMIDACERAEAWDSKNGRQVMSKRPTGLRDKAMLLMMLDCSIRVSELVALRMRDYDRRRGQVTIHHGKGDKKRIILSLQKMLGHEKLETVRI